MQETATANTSPGLVLTTTAAHRAARSDRRRGAKAGCVLHLAVLATALAVGAPAGAQTEGELRLIEHDDTTGRGYLEIYHDNEWGLICDDYWGKRDADVACRQLGYAGAVKAIDIIRGRSSARRFWLDDVDCVGNEASISDCPRLDNIGWGVDNCNIYSERAGVECKTDLPVGDTLGIYVSTRNVSVTESKGTGRYRIQLQTQPSGTVTVTPATTSTAITLSPTSLQFTTTDWNVQKEIVVTAVADADYTGTSATVTHTATGADYDGESGPSVTVAVSDPDDRASSVNPRRIEVTEEDPDGAEYRIKLEAIPTPGAGDVIVTVDVPDDAPVTVAPTSLTFTSTDWQVKQTITVTAQDDSNHTNETWTLGHSASGAGTTRSASQACG